MGLSVFVAFDHVLGVHVEDETLLGGYVGKGAFEEHLVLAVDSLEATFDIDWVRDDSFGGRQGLQFEVSQYFGGE